MTEGLKRYYGKQDLHFITFSCYQRRAFLDTADARNLFVMELARARSDYGFCVVGYVVMPDHVHLLLSEPAKGTPSTVLQMLKQRASHKIRNGVATGPARSAGTSIGVSVVRQFWQARFYDFNVYSHEKKNEKLEYMHANPVTRGLVQHPGEWVWSSFSFYARGEEGLVPVDPMNF